MRPSLLIVALCLVILISACSPTASRNSLAQPAQSSNSEADHAQNSNAASTTAVVKSQKANFRDKPSRSGAVVLEVEKNDRLTLVTPLPVGPWYRVRQSSTGSEGWIHGSVIILEKANQALPETERTRQVGSVTPTNSDRSYINVDGERVPSPVFSEPYQLKLILDDTS